VIHLDNNEMLPLLQKAKRRLARRELNSGTPPSQDSVPKIAAETPKQPRNGEPNNAQASSTLPQPVSDPGATDLWERAEEKVSSDDKLKRIWHAHLGILENELGSKLEPRGSAARQAQLDELLETKANALKEEKLKIFNQDMGALLNATFKNILVAKDIINAAASVGPPALIACAGATVILSVGLLLSSDPSQIPSCSQGFATYPMHSCSFRQQNSMLLW
jgi:hypothetical protein